VLEKQSVMLVFGGLLVAMFMSSLNQTVVSTALPTIVGELGGVTHMMWVTTAYVLAMTVTMPLYGKLGDQIGRKSLFVTALGLFLIGSVLCALSSGMGGFILGRAVQGLGGGGLMVLSQAIIADIVPPRYRGRYMGIMGAVFTIASVLGPIIGGWFTTTVGWRWAFWMNAPLGILAIAAAIVFLPHPRRRIAGPQLDVAGMTAMTVAVTSVVLLGAWAGNMYDWVSAQIVGLALLALVAGIVFVVAERGAREPIIPLRLFRNRNFNLTTLAGLFVSIAMFGTVSYMPTYLQIVEGLSPTVAGYLMVPMSLGVFVTSVGSGFVATRTGRYRWMPVASCAVTGLALLGLSSLTLDTSLVLIAAYVLLLGLGIGLGVQILMLIAQNEFRVAEVGTATATYTFFREIGASLGTALVGSVFTAGLTRRLAANLAGFGGTQALGVDADSLTPAIVAGLPEAVRHAVALAYGEAFTPVLLYIVPLMAAGALMLLFLRETPLRTTNEPVMEESGDDA